MKKLLIVLILLMVMICGCENMRNTPTSKVEDFLGKYQRMDQDVIHDLENVISKDNQMTEDQKKEYQTLLEKQYQNLSYKIKNEDIMNDNATVEVEIEVYDYQTAINNSKKYYQEHLEEFVEKDNKESMNDNKKYIDYKISEIKKVTTKTKNDIIFRLEYKENQWIINELSDEDLAKIHGLYES